MRVLALYPPAPPADRGREPRPGLPLPCTRITEKRTLPLPAIFPSEAPASAEAPRCSGSSRRGTPPVRPHPAEASEAAAARRARCLPPQRGLPALPPLAQPPRSAHASSPRLPLPPQWSAGWVTQQPPRALTALGRRGFARALPEHLQSGSPGEPAQNRGAGARIREGPRTSEQKNT